MAKADGTPTHFGNGQQNRKRFALKSTKAASNIECLVLSREDDVR